MLCNGEVRQMTGMQISMTKMPQEQADPEDNCSKGLTEHHQGPSPSIR